MYQIPPKAALFSLKMAVLGLWITLSSGFSIVHVCAPVHVYIQVRSAGFERDLIVQEYGLRVHDRMEEVKGRVLNPPAIKYKGNETVRSLLAHDIVCNYV